MTDPQQTTTTPAALVVLFTAWRQSWRRRLLQRALMAGMGTLALALALAALADGIWVLDHGPRLVLALASLLSAVLAALHLGLLSAWRGIDDAHIAAVFDAESDAPDGELYGAAVALSRRPPPGCSPWMLRRTQVVAARAAAARCQRPPRPPVGGPAPQRLVLFGTALLVALWLSGQGAHVLRVVLPISDLAASDGTVLTVNPAADVVLALGASLDIGLQVRPDPGAARLELRWADGLREVLPMAAAGPGRYARAVPGVADDLRWRVVAGSARSPWRLVQLRTPPQLEALSLQIEAPPHSGLPTRTVAGGEARVLAGSLLQLDLRVEGAAIRSARLRILEGEAPPPLRLIDDQHARTSWIATDDLRYQPEVLSVDGVLVPLGGPRRITVAADAAPVAHVEALLDPEARRLVIDPELGLALRLRLSDDLALASAGLLMEGPRRSWRRNLDDLAGRRDVERLLWLDPAEMDLRSGERLAVTLEVYDRSGQSTRSPSLEVLALSGPAAAAQRSAELLRRWQLRARRVVDVVGLIQRDLAALRPAWLPDDPQAHRGALRLLQERAALVRDHSRLLASTLDELPLGGPALRALADRIDDWGYAVQLRLDAWATGLLAADGQEGIAEATFGGLLELADETVRSAESWLAQGETHRRALRAEAARLAAEVDLQAMRRGLRALLAWRRFREPAWMPGLERRFLDGEDEQAPQRWRDSAQAWWRGLEAPGIDGERFIVQLAGELHLESPGPWRLVAHHDGGLRIELAGQELVGGAHWRDRAGGRVQRQIDLNPGWHPLRIVSLHHRDRAELRLALAGPESRPQAIPIAALRHARPGRGGLAESEALHHLPDENERQALIGDLILRGRRVLAVAVDDGGPASAAARQQLAGLLTLIETAEPELGDLQDLQAALDDVAAMLAPRDRVLLEPVPRSLGATAAVRRSLARLRQGEADQAGTDDPLQQARALELTARLEEAAEQLAMAADTMPGRQAIDPLAVAIALRLWEPGHARQLEELLDWADERLQRAPLRQGIAAAAATALAAADLDEALPALRLALDAAGRRTEAEALHARREDPIGQLVLLEALARLPEDLVHEDRARLTAMAALLAERPEADGRRWQPRLQRLARLLDADDLRSDAVAAAATDPDLQDLLLGPPVETDADGLARRAEQILTELEQALTADARRRAEDASALAAGRRRQAALLEALAPWLTGLDDEVLDALRRTMAAAEEAGIGDAALATADPRQVSDRLDSLQQLWWRAWRDRIQQDRARRARARQDWFLLAQAHGGLPQPLLHRLWATTAQRERAARWLGDIARGIKELIVIGRGQPDRLGAHELVRLHRLFSERPREALVDDEERTLSARLTQQTIYLAAGRTPLAGSRIHLLLDEVRQLQWRAQEAEGRYRRQAQHLMALAEAQLGGPDATLRQTFADLRGIWAQGQAVEQDLLRARAALLQGRSALQRRPALAEACALLATGLLAGGELEVARHGLAIEAEALVSADLATALLYQQRGLGTVLGTAAVLPLVVSLDRLAAVRPLRALDLPTSEAIWLALASSQDVVEGLAGSESGEVLRRGIAAVQRALLDWQEDDPRQQLQLLANQSQHLAQALVESVLEPARGAGTEEPKAATLALAELIAGQRDLVEELAAALRAGGPAQADLAHSVAAATQLRRRLRGRVTANVPPRFGGASGGPATDEDVTISASETPDRPAPGRGALLAQRHLLESWLDEAEGFVVPSAERDQSLRRSLQRRGAARLAVSGSSEALALLGRSLRPPAEEPLRVVEAGPQPGTGSVVETTVPDQADDRGFVQTPVRRGLDRLDADDERFPPSDRRLIEDYFRTITELSP